MLPFPYVFLSFRADQSGIWKIYDVTYFVYLQDLFVS